jgi:hypothetical protein
VVRLASSVDRRRLSGRVHGGRRVLVLLFLDSMPLRVGGVAGWNIMIGSWLWGLRFSGSAHCWVLRRHRLVFRLAAPGLDRLTHSEMRAVACVGGCGGGCGGLGCGCVLSVA